jgi:hypothetical protein
MAQRDWSERSLQVFIEAVSLLAAVVLLVTCASPTGTEATAPGIATGRVAPTPTPAGYWDPLPLTSQPEGGWKTYRNEELGLALQYPAVYDQLDCGQVVLFDKAYEDAAYTAIGLGAIRIRVYKAWACDLGERAAAIQAAPDIQLLTAVEPFSIDGVPAFRLVYSVPSQADLEYVKSAVVAFGGRLYEFSYHRTPVAYLQCDAPPLSQEAVYEHLLSTFEFTD